MSSPLQSLISPSTPCKTSRGCGHIVFHSQASLPVCSLAPTGHNSPFCPPHPAQSSPGGSSAAPAVHAKGEPQRTAKSCAVPGRLVVRYTSLYELRGKGFEDGKPNTAQNTRRQPGGHIFSQKRPKGLWRYCRHLLWRAVYRRCACSRYANHIMPLMMSPPVLFRAI